MPLQKLLKVIAPHRSTVQMELRINGKLDSLLQIQPLAQFLLTIEEERVRGQITVPELGYKRALNKFGVLPHQKLFFLI